MGPSAAWTWLGSLQAGRRRASPSASAAICFAAASGTLARLRQAMACGSSCSAGGREVQARTASRETQRMAHTIQLFRSTAEHAEHAEEKFPFKKTSACLACSAVDLYRPGRGVMRARGPEKV